MDQQVEVTVSSARCSLNTSAVSNLNELVLVKLVRNQVLLSMFTDFENFTIFKPAPQQEKSVNVMLDQVIAWGGALKSLREKQA